MDIEYEATFVDIDRDKFREILKSVGAVLVKANFLQKRTVFNLPSGHEMAGAWLRVRDEGDKITMSLKSVDGDKIENQKELCLNIDNFGLAVEFLESIGCQRKAFQESKRELWTLNGVEITIDEWPFLEPFVEIEAKTEKEVKATSIVLGFDYDQALFCAVDTLYSNKYGVSKDIICNNIKNICFDGENPFLKFAN
ncbi:MAG: CYTH domain-containing protein [Patescibacteria group bacterium]|nr:CYTH domain-containing protein [Patescibacteria group bacterium]